MCAENKYIFSIDDKVLFKYQIKLVQLCFSNIIFNFSRFKERSMLKPPMKVIYSFLSQIVFSMILVFSSLLNLSVPCYTYFAPLYILL